MSNDQRGFSSSLADLGIQKNFVTPAITDLNSVFVPLDFPKLLPELLEGCKVSESSDIFKKISEIGGLFDDYVVVDENAVKVFDLTGDVFIPLGNCRVKIHTLTLIAFLIGVCQFFCTQYQDHQQPEQPTECLERILEIQEDTNKTLHDLLDSIDAENSSQQEAVNSLSGAAKRLLDSPQVPAVVFQDPESSVDHSAMTPDNNHE